MNEPAEPHSYRKYIAFWVAFASSFALLLTGKLDGDQYVDIQVVIFGLYMAGNVGEHVARRGRWGRSRYDRYGGDNEW